MKVFILFYYLAYVVTEISAILPRTTPMPGPNIAPSYVSKTAQIINFVNSVYKNRYARSGGHDRFYPREEASNLNSFIKNMINILQSKEVTTAENRKKMMDTIRYHVIDNPDVLKRYHEKHKLKAPRSTLYKKSQATDDSTGTSSLGRRYRESSDPAIYGPYHVMGEIEEDKEGVVYYYNTITKGIYGPSFPDDNDDAFTAVDNLDAKEGGTSEPSLYVPSFPDDILKSSPANDNLDAKAGSTNGPNLYVPSFPDYIHKSSPSNDNLDAKAGSSNGPSLYVPSFPDNIHKLSPLKDDINVKERGKNEKIRHVKYKIDSLKMIKNKIFEKDEEGHEPKKSLQANVKPKSYTEKAENKSFREDGLRKGDLGIKRDGTRNKNHDDLKNKLNSWEGKTTQLVKKDEDWIVTRTSLKVGGLKNGVLIPSNFKADESKNKNKDEFKKIQNVWDEKSTKSAKKDDDNNTESRPINNYLSVEKLNKNVNRNKKSLLRKKDNENNKKADYDEKKRSWDDDGERNIKDHLVKEQKTIQILKDLIESQDWTDRSYEWNKENTWGHKDTPKDTATEREIEWDLKDNKNNKNRYWDKDDSYLKKKDEWDKKDSVWYNNYYDENKPDLNNYDWQEQANDWNNKDNNWNKKDNDWIKNDNDWRKMDNLWDKKNNYWYKNYNGRNKKDNMNKNDEDWNKKGKKHKLKREISNKTPNTNEWDKFGIETTIKQPVQYEHPNIKRHYYKRSYNSGEKKKDINDDYNNSAGKEEKRREKNKDSVPKIAETKLKKIKIHDRYERLHDAHPPD